MNESGPSLSCADVLGAEAAEAMRRAREFLDGHSTEDLLELVGRRLDELALANPPADKAAFPAGYGGGGPCEDDLLAARGMFYVTQAGRVMLDCTSGHYQMTWGYDHPPLAEAAAEAMRLGIVWDNHSNIPSLPVKLLADRLTALAAPAGLDRAMLGVCTGSVACSTALKIMIVRYREERERAALGPPVMVALRGNYHGTDVAAQTMRGMWPDLVTGMETAPVEPNDAAGLEAAFAEHGRRVAGFWAEPIMMNREAIALERDYLGLARELCSRHGALMALDEIQTGFWSPGVFAFRDLGLAPDFVVIGKGMTAGFHPLSGLLYRRELDVLAQYDAISTNGNASLAAYVALCNLRLIEVERERIAARAAQHEAALRAVAAKFPGLVEAVNGAGFLTGLRMRTRQDALGLHRAALGRGLWLRAHAYHEGHRTVLMKYPLAVEEAVVDWVAGRLRELLAATPWREEESG